MAQHDVESLYDTDITAINSIPWDTVPEQLADDHIQDIPVFETLFCDIYESVDGENQSPDAVAREYAADDTMALDFNDVLQASYRMQSYFEKKAVGTDLLFRTTDAADDLYDRLQDGAY